MICAAFRFLSFTLSSYQMDFLEDRKGCRAGRGGAGRVGEGLGWGQRTRAELEQRGHGAELPRAVGVGTAGCLGFPSNPTATRSGVFPVSSSLKFKSAPRCSGAS
jgi:hypothetical protein